ncbi:hypothetical protein I302_101171 [Kwoniella bestiolae CBS 10118]|uniref:Uncharacterized protein n=1 Tax=Kwoniella bestiolae CBS 10118 TaxID=1296100 RepID=A0A1B9G762_9TREE|nr:hypothetical protein I302_04546 [Kwoniella bestiolae CBS 10118]OCF26856.1 hypothetical protein I302_04546 [Kwoniella bestiolae CBS 10118]
MLRSQQAAGAGPIKQPGPYDLFPRPAVASWLDEIQAKIQKGLNPPDSPGPSRSPSPIIQEPQEEEVQDTIAELHQNGLSSDQQEVEYDEEDEFGEEFDDEDDDDELEAEYDEAEDQDHEVEAEYEDDDEQIDVDDQQPSLVTTQREPLFQMYDDDEEDEDVQNRYQEDEQEEQGEEDEDELFESRSQEEYDPAYGVVPEEDGAAYVGSDGDVYGDEDEEEEDEEEEEEEEEEIEEDEHEDEEEEEEESDDGIEYMGTSESPAPKSSSHQLTSPPNTLYPTLPLPPPTLGFGEPGQTPQSEDQISQLQPFSEDAIDPDLLAQVVQQVHDNMPEDDAGPSAFIQSRVENTVESADPSSIFNHVLPAHEVLQQPESAFEGGYEVEEEDQQREEEVAYQAPVEQLYEEDELDDEEESQGSYDDDEDDAQEEEQGPAIKRPVFTEVIEIGSSSEEDDDEEEEQVENDYGNEEEEEEEEEVEYTKDGDQLDGDEDEDEDDGDETGDDGSDENDKQEPDLEQIQGDAQESVFVEPRQASGEGILEEVDDEPEEESEMPQEAIMYDGEVIEDRHIEEPEMREPAYLEEGTLPNTFLAPIQLEEIDIVEITEREEPVAAEPSLIEQQALPEAVIENVITAVIEESETVVEESALEPQELPIPADTPILESPEEINAPHVTDEFTMDIDETPVIEDDLEEANFSPFQTPAVSTSQEPFNGDDLVAFDPADTPDISAEPSSTATPAVDPTIKDFAVDIPAIPAISDSASTLDSQPNYSEDVAMGDPTDALPDPRASPPDSQTIMPNVPHIQQPLSEVSPSLIVEPPAHPQQAEAIPIDDEATPDPPVSLPDPKLSPPGASTVMPLVPHDTRPSVDRSPSLAVEPPERDPVPEDVPTAAASRSSTPVSLPDPTVPPPNTSAAQPLDIHNMVPHDHITPSLVVEIPQDPIPGDITSAISSRAATPPSLPDPGLPPADTSATGPLNPHDLVPHPPSSPSLIVEPPGRDPVPSDILSAPATRATTPIELPDPTLPPPDSYLEAPITPHQLIPSEDPQTPSLQVEAATDSPAQTMSRNPSGLGSFVQFSSSDVDVDVMSEREDDDDIQVHVRWIEPASSTQDVSTNAEEEDELHVEKEEEDDDNQIGGDEETNEEKSGEVSQDERDKLSAADFKQTDDPAIDESTSDDDIQVDVWQVSPEQPGEQAQPAQDKESLGSDEGQTDLAQEIPSEVVVEMHIGASSDTQEEPPVATSSTLAERSDEEKTETGSPQKEKPPFLPQVSESTIMRLFHRHGSPNNAPGPGPSTVTHRRTRSRGRPSDTSNLEPPTTRSRCYYEKLRVSDDDLTAVILVPHCAIPEIKQLEQESARVEGRSSESEEAEGRSLPMDVDHPILLPQLTTKIRRIVGHQLVDEGHCYVLYAKDDAKLPEVEPTGTPKGTPNRGHRKRKSVGGVTSRLSTGGDDEDSNVSIKVESYDTPAKKRATLSPPATRSARKRGTASASVEPDSEAGVTPARRGRGGRPSSTRKGKGRESSIISDVGSVRSNTASPGPGLRRSARMSIARGEHIPEMEEGTPAPAEDDPESKSITAAPAPQLESSQSPTKPTARRTTRMSLRGKQNASTVTPQPQPEVDTGISNAPADEIATPSGSTRLSSPRKPISSASKVDEAPYRPESEEDDEEEAEDAEPPSSTRSAFSVEIPTGKKRKPRASEADDTIKDELDLDSTPASSTRKRKARAVSNEPDDNTETAGGEVTEQVETPRETRGMKRRAVESKLVPGTPVPEPQSPNEEDEDIEVTAENSPTTSRRLGRNEGWSGRLMKRFGWGRN